MNRFVMFSIALAALLALAFLNGCAKKTATTNSEAPVNGESKAAATAVATAYPKSSIKIGDKAVCVICAIKEGSANPEEIKAVLDYQGKTYAFCSEAEKAEFISEPAKYAQTGP